jgi:hypothetical protein
MLEAASTSETSVNFYQSTQCNNPADSHLHGAWFPRKIHSYSGDQGMPCFCGSSEFITMLAEACYLKSLLLF